MRLMEQPAPRLKTSPSASTRGHRLERRQPQLSNLHLKTFFISCPRFQTPLAAVNRRTDGATA
jgi:hypothetical protein